MTHAPPLTLGGAAETIQPEIDHWRGKQGQQLAQGQTAGNGNPQRTA